MVDLASLMARMCFNKTKLTQLTVIADVKTVQDGSWSGAWAKLHGETLVLKF